MASVDACGPPVLSRGARSIGSRLLCSCQGCIASMWATPTDDHILLYLTTVCAWVSPFCWGVAVPTSRTTILGHRITITVVLMYLIRCSDNMQM
jgi:hypothetical protein